MASRTVTDAVDVENRPPRDLENQTGSHDSDEVPRSTSTPNLQQKEDVADESPPKKNLTVLIADQGYLETITGSVSPFLPGFDCKKVYRVLLEALEANHITRDFQKSEHARRVISKAIENLLAKADTISYPDKLLVARAHQELMETYSEKRTQAWVIVSIKMLYDQLMVSKSQHQRNNRLSRVDYSLSGESLIRRNDTTSNLPASSGGRYLSYSDVNSSQFHPPSGRHLIYPSVPQAIRPNYLDSESPEEVLSSVSAPIFGYNSSQFDPPSGTHLFHPYGRQALSINHTNPGSPGNLISSFLATTPLNLIHHPAGISPVVMGGKLLVLTTYLLPHAIFIILWSIIRI